VFDTVERMTPEQRFSQLRTKPHLDAVEVAELLAMTETLFAERLTLRQHLDRIRYDFANLRKGLNGLDEAVKIEPAQWAAKALNRT
jgi:hypothetical protein